MTTQNEPYEIKTGIDGKLYAVFANCDELEDLTKRSNLFDDCRPACFGQFDNAFELARRE